MSPTQKPPGSWTEDPCTVCGDDCTASSHIVLDDSTVCASCVQRLFTIALANETNFPPRWGSTTLKARDFAHILPPEKLKKYVAREKEWTCPPTDRVYCQGQTRKGEVCSRFLGRRSEMRKRMEYVGCRGCWWFTCLRCAACFDLGEDPEKEDAGGPVEVQHVCSRKKTGGEDEAFKGLKRGRDYQICPHEGCRRKAELAEGCNHISCVCGTNYCFICAKKAEEDSDHWRAGGCPRYGQPGSATALYNDDIRMANDDGSEVDNEDFWRWQMQVLVEQEEEGLLAERHALDASGRQEERRRVPVRRRSRQGGIDHGRPPTRRGPGNLTEVTGGPAPPAPPTRPRAAPESASGRRPKRGLRQIIHERGRGLIDRFRP